MKRRVNACSRHSRASGHPRSPSRPCTVANPSRRRRTGSGITVLAFGLNGHLHSRRETPRGQIGPSRGGLTFSVPPAYDAGMTEPSPLPSIRIYVDADACPVKAEIYRVAERYGLPVYVVANAWIAVPRDPRIERVVVGDGFDAADDWIAAQAGTGDIVVTADI